MSRLHLTYRARAVLLTLTACATVLVAATLVLAASARADARRAFVERVRLQAGIVAASASGSLAFLQEEAATDVLAGFAADETVEAAWLLDPEGAVFVVWSRPGIEPGPVPFGVGQLRIDAGRVVVTEPITLDGQPLGQLVVRSDMGPMSRRLRHQAISAGLVLLVGLAVAGLLAERLQRALSRPLERLDAMTRRVTESGDFSIRAEESSIPEMGRLAAGLNRMLEEIDARGRALAESNETLEQRVRRRTEDLRTAVARMQSEIEVRQQAETRMRAAQKRAEAANAAKSAFLANMSHEIRTPMTAILGFADVMLEAESSAEDRADAARTIKRNGEHLLTIINDILDLSKIEAGRMEVERIDTPLTALLDDVVALMQVRAAGKGIDLELDWTTPVPETVRTDPVRLRQVLVNLVGNAIKFTETGGVRIEAAMEDVDGDAPMLRLDVRDTGIGIDPEAQQRLFRPFAQADGSMTRRFGGTGLGLAISRRLAEILGGSIDVASTLGEGSTFSVRIDPGPVDAAACVTPAARGEAGDPRPVAAAPGPVVDRSRPLEGVRLLLVEDGPDNQRLIGHVLRRAGATVEVRANGREGVDAILGPGAVEIDLVLLDMQMPVLDGYAAARELRDRGWTGPVVALTAHAMEGDRERCLRSGCDEYTTKPIDRAVLIATVQRTLAGDGDRRRAA